MMVYTVDTYHSIQSIGIDKLRNANATSGPAIRSKTQVSKIEALKRNHTRMRNEPRTTLNTQGALAEGATIHKNRDD